METIYKIKCVANGWQITRVDEDEEIIVVGVEDGNNEVQSFANFLRDIESNFGPMNSRYDKHRIYISVLPGSKFEGKPDQDQIETVDFLSSLVSEE